MAPPDKKRALPPNVNSAVTPPSKRRQMSSDAAGADQQSAAASAHPTAMAAAAAALFVAPAVDCLTTSAGRPRSAVFAARRLSPAARCDQDSLSVALSFLNTRDFAAASRVSCHWRRAAELQSAWPEFSVERLISCLIEDDRRWTQSRSARVNANHLVSGVLQRLAQSSKWRRLFELHVDGFVEGQRHELVRLSQAAQLPQLQSLRLAWARLTGVASAFSSMALRLLALRCDALSVSDAVQLHLHLCTNLRVLSLDHLTNIDDQALLLLHQLEYLQLRYCHFQRDPLPVIRRLSVQHRLQHLSLTFNTISTLRLDPLVIELRGADSGLAPAALVTFRVFGNLSLASHSALLSLPSLTRLHWISIGDFSKPTVRPQLSSSPSPLQRLHLNFDHGEGGGAVHLLQLAAVRAPQLRELHMGRLPPSFDQLIRPLHSLRLLDIKQLGPLMQSPELLQSLAALPLFAELIVRQDSKPPQPFKLTLGMLRCIAESRSWRLIRVLSWSGPPLLRVPDSVDARLAERLVGFRVHSELRSGTSKRRLTLKSNGTWLQTAN